MQKKAISAVKWTTLSSVFSVIISILRIAILVRLLEKSAFGLIAIVMFIMGISSLFTDVGLSVAILHKQNITNNQYSSLYCFNLLVGLIIFTVVSAIAPWVAYFYQEPELTNIIPIMAITILLAVSGLQHKVIERKELNFKFIESVEIISNIIAFITAITLAHNGYGVYALIYSVLGQYLFANSIYIFRGLRSRKYTLRLQKAELKPFLAIGGFQMAGQFLNYFSSQMDILLIGKLLGMNILGGYNLAKSLAARPQSIINPVINKVAAPVLALMQGNEEQLQNNFLRLLKILSLINFPIFFGAAVLAKPLIELFYGTAYSNYSQVFMWMCFYMLLRSTISPIGSLVTAKGRTDLEFYWNILVLFTMPLVIFVTSYFNINIIALGLFLLMLIYLFVSFFMMIQKILKISLLLYLSQMVYALLLSIVMAIIVFIIYNTSGHNFVSLLISIFVGILVYASLLYLFGLRIDQELFQKIYKMNLFKKIRIKPLLP